jgi:hypothetical protein
MRERVKFFRCDKAYGGSGTRREHECIAALQHALRHQHNRDLSVSKKSRCVTMGVHKPACRECEAVQDLSRDVQMKCA